MIPVIDLSDERDDSERTTEQDAETQPSQQGIVKATQGRAPALGLQRCRRSLLNRLRHTRLGCWLIRRGWLMPSWGHAGVPLREGVCVRFERHEGGVHEVISPALKHKGFLFCALEGIARNDQDFVDAEELA